MNPTYKRALKMLLKQLAWDVAPYAFAERRKLQSLRNKYRGRKAVILCNGPSLLSVDFELLSRSGVFCFGLNKIFLLFDKTAFRPDAIVAVNRYVIEQSAKDYESMDIPLLLDSKARGVVNKTDGLIWINEEVFPAFSQDCSRGVYQGYTVTFVALQLAKHFGFSEVALVGCDHNFISKGPANQAVLAGNHDQDHFDKRYFSGGVQWQLPDLLQSEVSYLLAKDAFERDGGRVVNCTEGGKLEVYPRVALQDFLFPK